MEVASATAPATTVGTPEHVSPSVPAVPAGPISGAATVSPEMLDRVAQSSPLSATLARAVAARATKAPVKAPATVTTLVLDGVAAGSVLSATGGGSRQAVVDSPTGHANSRIKHSSTVEVEPITLTCGAMGPAFYEWLSGSLKKQYNRRSGAIVTTDARGRELERLEFYDALIVETTLSALDRTAKKPAWMTVKIQPERSQRSPRSSAKRGASKAPKKPKALSSSFRLVIDGVDGPQRATRLESFTIKQGVKKFHRGADPSPQLEPTKLEFPILVLTVPLAYADDLLEWQDRYVTGAGNDRTQLKSGVLEILAGDGKTVLFALQLYEVGLHHASVRSGAAGGGGKAVKAQLHVGRMDLDTPGGGMD